MRGDPSGFGLNFHSNVSPWVPRCLKVSASRMLGFRTRVETEYQLTRIARSNSTIIAGPWLGEFGWELFFWSGYCRALSRHFEKTTIITRPGRDFLYRDFAIVLLNYLNHKYQYQ